MRAGALFAGIGGFCLGFEQAGIPTAWAVEMDPHAVVTYRSNIENARIVATDIRDVSVKGSKLDPVDILHAGFPCQSFSQAGERRGFEDERGKLFFEITRIIKEFGSEKPKVIVLENSPFLKWGEGGAWFLEVQKHIQKAGYWFRDANAAELNAFDITALPQQRTRLFMVAFSTEHFRNGRFDFNFPKSDVPKDISKYVNFDSQQAQNYYLPHENRYFEMISGRVEDRKSLYQLRKYIVRVKEANTCPTLTANMGLGGHNVPFAFDAGGLRKLTEHECLKLQGFPSKFRFPAEVPRAKRYVQIGNAVTVPVAKLIAGRVRAKLEGEA